MPTPVDRKYGKIFFEGSSDFHEDEPVFVLRGQDRAALATLSAYYESCKVLGTHINHLSAVDEVITLFRDWQDKHPELTKIPD